VSCSSESYGISPSTSSSGFDGISLLSCRSNFDGTPLVGIGISENGLSVEVSSVSSPSVDGVDGFAVFGISFFSYGSNFDGTPFFGI